MPTYEYRCTSCAHDFEKVQRMSDEPGAECPECGSASERRLSGGAGFLFKGSGFYITDYRSEGYKKAEKKESGSGDSGGKAKTGDGASSAKSSPADSSGSGSSPAPASGPANSSGSSGSKGASDA